MSRKRGFGVVAVAFAALFMLMNSAHAVEYVYTPDGLNVYDAIASVAPGFPPVPPTSSASSLPGWPNIDNFVNSASPEYYADVLGASINVQREFRRALPSIYSYSQTAHYQEREGAATTGSYYADAGNGTYVVCPTTMCSPGKKWVMWDVPFLDFETKSPQDGYLGYKQTATGFATGVSRMFGAASAIGLAVGYDQREMKEKDKYHFRNNADTFHVALYGGTNVGMLFLDAYAGFSHSWNRSERFVYSHADLVNYDINKGKYGNSVWSAGLKASYVWILGNDTRITPSVGLDFSHSSNDSFTERGWYSNGAGEASDDSLSKLAVESDSYSNVAIPLMVSANKTFRSGFLRFKGNDSLWTPEVRAGYVPVLGSSRAGATAAFASANPNLGSAKVPAFKAESNKFTGSYGTVGAGLKIKLAERYIFGVDYDYTMGSEYSNHSLTAMYGVSF